MQGPNVDLSRLTCPACKGSLVLVDSKVEGDISTVHRRCPACSLEWVFFFGRRDSGERYLLEVIQKGSLKDGPGFDYTCPSCSFTSRVRTVYHPTSKWNCLRCKAPIPLESLKFIGGYTLPSTYGISERIGNKVTPARQTPRVRRSSGSTSGISLAQLAEEMEVEPKKLRSWLRKARWREESEAKSQWVFSSEEAEEIKRRFGRR